MARNLLRALIVAGLLLGLGGAASAQGPVELKSTAPSATKPFDITAPGPSAREITRVPDAEFYREDQLVPYQPAFIEPLVGTKGGATVGASAWTSPQTPVGSLGSQIYQQNPGWFGFGLTFIWDSPGRPSARPSSAR